MKLTVLQLLTSTPVLDSLSKQPLKGVSSFRVRRMIQALTPSIQAASSSRDSLFSDSNSDVLPNGSRQMRPEHFEAVLNDPLFAEEINIDIEPLTETDLVEASISSAQLDQLGPLLA